MVSATVILGGVTAISEDPAQFLEGHLNSFAPAKTKGVTSGDRANPGASPTVEVQQNQTATSATHHQAHLVGRMSRGTTNFAVTITSRV